MYMGPNLINLSCVAELPPDSSNFNYRFKVKDSGKILIGDPTHSLNSVNTVHTVPQNISIKGTVYVRQISYRSVKLFVPSDVSVKSDWYKTVSQGLRKPNNFNIEPKLNLSCDYI